MNLCLRTPRVLAVPVLIALLAVACGGGGSAQATPTSTALPATSTQPPPAATATAEPAVESPDPGSLLLPGYVLDQSLDVSLDGADPGQLVVISYTTRQVFLCSDQAPATLVKRPGVDCENSPPVVAPPEGECPTGVGLEIDPSACVYRVEIFAYDTALGWTSRPITGIDFSATEGTGIQLGIEVASFSLDADREALVVASESCTGVGSGCGVRHVVLTMKDGSVEAVYFTWKAQFDVGDASATFSFPVYLGPDNVPFCCPNGRQMDTVGLDPDTDEVAVIESELLVCTEGTLSHSESLPDSVRITCDTQAASPGATFAIADNTVVEPATLGGVDALRDGDRVMIEYRIEECPEGLSCGWSRQLVATKITVVNR